MIKISFVVKARAEVAWYGLEMPRQSIEVLKVEYGSSEAIEILEGYEHLFNGLAVADRNEPANDDLDIRYYIQDEESGEDLGDDRRVDISKVSIIRRKPARKKCESGNAYLCGGDRGEGYEDQRDYDAGFHPPFKSEDVTLIVEDLEDFGYAGCIVSGIRYDKRDPEHIETEVIFADRLPTVILED